MNYLKVSKRLASYTNPDQEGSYDTQIDVIQVVMQLLTFGLLLTFCGFGIKKAVEKIKGGGGVSSGGGLADSILTKIKSSVGDVWRLAGRGKTKTPPREQELAVRHPTGMADALPRTAEGNALGSTVTTTKGMSSPSEFPTSTRRATPSGVTSTKLSLVIVGATMA